VLSGAHTLGGKGFGDPTKFDNTYFKVQGSPCPAANALLVFTMCAKVAMCMQSLIEKPWLNTDTDSMAKMIGLPSDWVLSEDPELAPMIEVSVFFFSFVSVCILYRTSQFVFLLFNAFGLPQSSV
jgi:L-ascorbate peroxidase